MIWFALGYITGIGSMLAFAMVFVGRRGADRHAEEKERGE